MSKPFFLAWLEIFSTSFLTSGCQRTRDRFVLDIQVFTPFTSCQAPLVMRFLRERVSEVKLGQTCYRAYFPYQQIWYSDLWYIPCQSGSGGVEYDDGLKTPWPAYFCQDTRDLIIAGQVEGIPSKFFSISEPTTCRPFNKLSRCINISPMIIVCYCWIEIHIYIYKYIYNTYLSKWKR